MEYVIYEAKEKTIPVARELLFLNNYVDLANQRSGNKSRFNLSSTGTHDTLTIAPLLLVGFIDKVVTEDKTGISCLFSLEFSQSNLLFSVINKSSERAGPLITKNDLVYRTMAQVYEGRFILEQNENEKMLELNLLLDEEI
jgi:hypothetical protein